MPTVALITFAAGPLAAQEEQTDTTEVVPLQPVIVNVLRTPFPVTAAPFSVAVKTEAEVQRARPGLGMEEALGGIPGVQVDDRYNYALGDRISIRGFGARTQFGVRGVKVIVDGIPATLPDGQTSLNHVDLSFLNRVEVIRGPASALYGNSAGGVIEFESELPPAVPISQEFGLVSGSDGLVRFNSTTGGQAGGASYLFNVGRLTYEGYREFQDADNLQLNGSVGFDAAGGDLQFVGSFVDYDANNPGSLSSSLLEADRTQAYSNNVRQQTGESGRQGQLGASWSRSLGTGALEVAGYGMTREISNPIPPSIIDLDRVASGLRAVYRSSEQTLVTGASWAVGVEGALQQDDRKNFANDEGSRGSLDLDQAEEVLGGSVFGQLTVVPIERLTAMAGLRYDVTRFHVDDHLVTNDPDDSGERTMDAISPSLGLSYEISQPLSVYGNVATSFETPTTTELANQPSGAGGFNPDLEPQRAVSYEVGVKGLVNGMMSYQLAAYRADISDALIPFEIPGSEGRSFFRNAGSAVHQGIEAGLTVAPLRGVRANVAYTYLDAHFTDYDVGSDSFDGNDIPGVSPHRVDATVTYTAPFGWYATLEGRYAADMPVDDENEFSSPAYTVFDIRTGLEELATGDLRIQPFVGVTNLLDEEYNTSVTVNAFGQRYFEPGPGRAFYAGAQVRMDWQ